MKIKARYISDFRDDDQITEITAYQNKFGSF